jgi:hypothetical protein
MLLLDQFSLVASSFFLHQLVEQAPVVDAPGDVLAKKAVLVLGEAVQYLPLRCCSNPARQVNKIVKQQ